MPEPNSPDFAPQSNDQKRRFLPFVLGATNERAFSSCLTVPTLILTGDEDWPCLEPGLLMKREIASAALAIIPNAGHTINLETAAEFNRLTEDFLHAVDAGRWPIRDPRAMVSAILGNK